MNRAERWGTELAMLVRRQQDQERELDETKRKIDGLIEKIRTEPTETLYGPATGEFDAVNVSMATDAPVRPLRDLMSEVATQVPIVPGYAGETTSARFEPRLTNVPGEAAGWWDRPSDETAVVEMPTDVAMSAIVGCPRKHGGECWEPMRHVHTADGGIHPLPDSPR